MAKLQIKSEKLTPFGGFFSIMEQFDALLAQTIDSTLGLWDALCLVINIARFYALWCAYIFVVAHVLRMLQLTWWNICLFIQLKSTVLSLSWILSLLRNGKENRIVLFPTKPYRLRIWGKISFATKVRFIFGLCKDMRLFFLFFPHTFPRSPLVSSLISEM